MKVHAQIEYQDIHSDICPKNCEFKNIDKRHRQLLHDCLDEWLDNSQGIGAFRIYQDGVLPDCLNK